MSLTPQQYKRLIEWLDHIFEILSLIAHKKLVPTYTFSIWKIYLAKSKSAILQNILGVILGFNKIIEPDHFHLVTYSRDPHQPKMA